jgi:predicted DNA-binding ribbon-helix-helix protein
LLDIARRRDVTISQLIESIDANRTQTNLSSAVRLFVLAEYRDQIEPPLEPKQTRALSR